MIHARTKSAEDTQLLAASIAELVRPRDLVLLVGEIGAGKTTFTQGFGKALGVDENITSPTFVLVRSYQAKIPLHHVDIYRLDHLQEVIDLGLMEMLDEGGVALMEWGDLAVPVLPRDYLEIQLKITEDGLGRTVRFRGIGNNWALREKSICDFITNWLVPEDEVDENQ